MSCHIKENDITVIAETEMKNGVKYTEQNIEKLSYLSIIILKNCVIHENWVHGITDSCKEVRM